MKISILLGALVAAAPLSFAAPAPADSDPISDHRAAMAQWAKDLVEKYKAEGVPGFTEDASASSSTLVERQIVYQNYYFCPRDVENPWKRSPCLPEDAASKVKRGPEADADAEKRQIIYQNFYFCPRSVNGVWKRVPCLPEDAAAKTKKRFAEAAVAAEAKMAEWDAEMKI